MGLILWVMVPAMTSDRGIGSSAFELALLGLLLLPSMIYASIGLGETATVGAGILLDLTILVFLIPGAGHLKTIDDGMEGLYILQTIVVSFLVVCAILVIDRGARRQHKDR
jgi:hypothetical protein